MNNLVTELVKWFPKELIFVIKEYLGFESQITIRGDQKTTCWIEHPEVHIMNILVDEQIPDLKTWTFKDSFNSFFVYCNEIFIKKPLHGEKCGQVLKRTLLEIWLYEDGSVFSMDRLKGLYCLVEGQILRI